MTWDDETPEVPARCVLCGEKVMAAASVGNALTYHAAVCPVTKAVERQLRALGFTREIEP